MARHPAGDEIHGRNCVCRANWRSAVVDLWKSSRRNRAGTLSMKRIDTHQHLWDLKQFPYSWCAGIPALNRSFLLDDYLASAKDTGIEKCVFVECDVDEPNALAEAQHVQKLSEKNPIIAGIVAAVRPERVDFPAQLEALLKLPRLRGVRRVLHVVPDETSQPALFAENVN